MTLVLPEPIIPELEAHLAAFSQPGVDGLVFTGDKGGPLRDHVWQTKWARARRAVGHPDLHFHDLRHEAISRFFEMGLTTPEVASISGHRDIRMLMRYAHPMRQSII